MKARETIEWDPPKLARFKKVYAEARDRRLDTFMFDGHEFVIGYAEYLIEYLEGALR